MAHGESEMEIIRYFIEGEILIHPSPFATESDVSGILVPIVTARIAPIFLRSPRAVKDGTHALLLILVNKSSCHTNDLGSFAVKIWSMYQQYCRVLRSRRDWQSMLQHSTVRSDMPKTNASC